MNVKKTIKKIVALGAGAALVGATILGAVATADLANYPEPFSTDGVWSGKIVVGENAQVPDIISGINFVAETAGLSYIESEIENNDGTVIVTNGKTEEVTLGLGLNTDFGTLDDDDLPGLQDTSVNIDIGDVDEDYDVHDEIILDSTISVNTGLTVSSPSEDFGTDVFLEVAKDSIEYKYVFDDTLETGNYISNATDDDPIDIVFLGMSMSITDADENSIEVEVGEEMFIDAGAEFTYNGQVVELVQTSSLSAVIRSAGETFSLEADETEDFGDLKIKCLDIFNDDGIEFDSAKILIGEETTKTYDDGDEFIGEDEDDPNWVWNLGDLNTNTPVIGIEYDQVLDEDDEVILMGEEIALPNDFATISVVSVNQDDYQDYLVDAVTEDLYNETGDGEMSSEKVLHFHTEGTDDGFTVDGEETDDVYLYWDTTDTLTAYWADDSDGNKPIESNMTMTNNTAAYTMFTLDYKDTSINVNVATGDYASNDMDMNITFDFDNQDIVLLVNVVDDVIEYIGTVEDDSETGDLVVGDEDISDWEADTMTKDGVIINAYDSQDELEFSVPEEQDEFAANVVVKMGSGSVETSSSTYKESAVRADLSVMDSEVEVGDTNLIVIGGPCANTIAFDLMGAPAVCGEGFSQGKGLIKFFETGDYMAILVAGYGAEDTAVAVDVLINYEDYATDFAGKSEVEVTNVNSGSPEIVAPVEEPEDNTTG